ncbi:hypothetical protein KY329_03475 [Candidatus Woesearchaeota archaeon]|nr:hypothetical protein [Candidatus Woesearchaeota archaeon]
MKAVIVLTVLLLGILAGFAFFYDADSTVGAAVACSMNNQDCNCSHEFCTCGEITIRAEECYSNSNL